MEQPVTGARKPLVCGCVPGRVSHAVEMQTTPNIRVILMPATRPVHRRQDESRGRV